MKFPQFPWTDAAARWLGGAPDLVLTGLLIVAAVIIGLIALRAHPALKALALAYILLP